MRRAEKEITDPREIEEILAEAKVCRIAMIDAGAPYVVPVCFGYEAGAPYFHSAPDGRKIEALMKNPLYVLRWIPVNRQSPHRLPASGG